MKKFLKKWLGPIIIAVTLAAVIIIGLVTKTLPEAIKAVAHANPLCMLACVLCYLSFITVNGLSAKSFLKREGYSLTMREALLVSMTGVYYSNVTPGAAGGQPMQIYRLSQLGVPVGVGSSAIASGFISWHLMRVFLFTGLAIPYWGFIMENLGGYWPFLLLGYAYNVFFVVMWLIFSFSKKPVAFIVRLAGKIIKKLKLSKDPDKLLAGMNRTADMFYDSMRHLKSHKGEIFRQLLFGLLYMLSLVSILYFAYLGVGLRGATYGELTTMGMGQYISAAYMPTPGASGAQEGLFELYFGRMMQGSSLLAVMLIWRFMSYYLGLLIGAVVNLAGKKRAKGGVKVSEKSQNDNGEE